MKYIVIEQCKTYSVLLSENGQFYKAANLNYKLGDIVENPVLMKNKLSSSLDLKWYKFKNNLRYSKMKSVLVSLALVLILIVGVFGGFYYRENFLLTKSSIIMQINPKVGLDLNAKGSVIQLTGLNADGETLLKDYKQTSKNKVEVINDLIQRAQDLNFLKEGGKVTLGINAKNEQTFEELGIELREKVNPSKIIIEIIRAENIEESDYLTVPENFKTEITIKPKSTEQITSTEVAPSSKKTTTKTTATKPTVIVSTPTIMQSTTNYDDSNYGDSNYGDSNYNEANELNQNGDSPDDDSLYENDD